MKNTTLLSLGACALFASTCISAQAEVLANFTFDADSAASSDTSIFSDAMTNWDLTNSAPATTITGGFSSVHASGAADPAGTSATTVNPSNIASEWQQFSFTVANLGAGETLNLTSFDYDYKVTNAHASFESAVYSNLSGYTGTGDSLGGVSGIAGNTNATFTPSISLSGDGDFSGLTNGAIVEFRIYLKDSSGVIGRVHELDNIVLNGTVVPEPGSFALIAGMLGLTSVMLRRRSA